MTSNSIVIINYTYDVWNEFPNRDHHVMCYSETLTQGFEAVKQYWQFPVRKIKTSHKTMHNALYNSVCVWCEVKMIL